MARAIDGDALKRWCEKIIDQACHPATVQIGEVFLDKVRSIPTLTQPNEPLTLEELRKMDGEPVYMTFPSDTGNQCGHWALVGTQRWGAVSLIYGCGWSSYESAVETLGAKFYRRPPEGEGDGAK
mgnify:CR=1 FL=1